LQRICLAGSREKVSPLEDFSKAVLMQAMDNGADSGFRADDQEFDGFSVWLGIAMQLEGEFETDSVLSLVNEGFGNLVAGSEEGLSWHGDITLLESTVWMSLMIVDRLGVVNSLDVVYRMDVYSAIDL
jgi:hypothetical protein